MNVNGLDERWRKGGRKVDERVGFPRLGRITDYLASPMKIACLETHTYVFVANT